jgi:hypothetical protein
MAGKLDRQLGAARLPALSQQQAIHRPDGPTTQYDNDQNQREINIHSLSLSSSTGAFLRPYFPSPHCHN